MSILTSKKKKAATDAANAIDKAQLVELINEEMKSDDNFWTKKMKDGNIGDAKQICTNMLQDDAHLERLLVARKYNPKATVDLFWEQVRFRATYKPVLDESIVSKIPNALPSGTWRLCGYTKAGCIVSNYKLEFWDPNTYGNSNTLDEAVEEYTYYVCYMIELMIASMKKPEGKFAVLFDLNGFYMSMVTKTNVRMMIRKLIYVAQAQYPERLEHVYLVNAPFGFETAWSLIKPLLDVKTASKIQFCTTAKLLEDIDASVLSTNYGGEHEEYPIPSKTIQEEAYN